jgi:hypothetical protein
MKEAKLKRNFDFIEQITRHQQSNAAQYLIE